MKKTPATTTEMTSAASASDHYVSNITLPVAKAGSYIGTFPIDQIKVATRHRQDLGDIAALAESVRKLGLLQPIGIGRDRNFIFGEHRLRACQYLGLDTIQARIIDVDSLLANWDVIVNRLTTAGCRCSSTLLGVTRLAYPEMMIEIEATATK